MVTGAVFTTDSGPFAIRARHGVLVCRKEIAAGDDFYRRLPGDPVLRVALVGKDASRFGRVELLTSDAEIAEIARPTSEHTAGAVTAHAVISISIGTTSRMKANMKAITERIARPSSGRA